MAEAIGMGFDVEALLDSIKKADVALENLLKKNDERSKSVINTFQQMSKQGVGAYTESLEKQLKLYESINAAITTNSGRAKKGFGDMKASVSLVIDSLNDMIKILQQTNVYKDYKIKLITEKEVADLKAYTTELEKMFRSEQAYAQRVQALKEANASKTRQELNEYKNLTSEIERLTKIQREASSVMNNPKAPNSLKYSAAFASSEAMQQIVDLQERRKQLEAKYEGEITVIKHQAAMERFAEEKKMWENEVREKEAQAEREKRAAADVANYELQRFIETQNKKKQAEMDMEAIRERNRQKYVRELEEMFRREKQMKDDIARYEKSKFEESLNTYRKNKEAQASVDKHYHDKRQRELEEMFRREEILTRARNKSNSNTAINTFSGMYSSRGNQSLNNMNKALQMLQDSQSKVNLKTKEGVEEYARLDKRIQYLQRTINATTNSLNNMQNAHGGLMNTAGQLARQLALVFSVSSIQGYMNKLVSIRGEMELQQRSLQVLLQSKDEADRLWQQTIDLAVKSPFRVGQLVSYTRQLAAYRIETEKLHDTTKRLADVSAGLGVDMNRIILAFGQVRAANFLRGTELRQFTEAGIPMLDELAKLFSELEGRVVSTGDVFERISKRMVTFGDVEEVFHRMTDAGGVFYKMQEEQSETLKGQISNLHDSIDLMLNDIGRSNDGILKGGVQAVRAILENWHEVAYSLERVVGGMAAWKLANMAYIAGMKKAATVTLWGNNALKANIGASMVNIKTLKWSEAALVGVTKRQLLLGKATLYLQGAVRGLGIAFKTALPFLLIGGLMELVRIMTKSSREAARLRKELNEIYNEDTSSLKKQTDTFKDLVERLKNVNEGSKEHKDIISKLNNQYGEYLGFLVTEKTTYDELAGSINSVTTALTQKAKLNTFEKALSKVTEKTTKDLLKITGDIEKVFTGGTALFKDGNKGIYATSEETQDILSLIKKETLKNGEILSKDSIKKILSTYFQGDVTTLASVYHDAIQPFMKNILKQKREEEEIQKQINSLYGGSGYQTAKMREEMEALNKEEEKALASTKSRIEKEKIAYEYAAKRVQKEGEYQGLSQEAIDKNIAKLQKTSATVQDINRQLIASTNELGKETVDRVYITAQDASQGTNAIAENAAASWRQMQTEIENQNKLKEAGTIHDESALQNAEMMAKAYHKVLEIMGRLDLIESSGNKKDKQQNILKNRISLVEQLYKEYTELNKHFGSKESEEQVRKAFSDTFTQAFEGTGIDISMYAIKKELVESSKNVGESAGEALSEGVVSKLKELEEAGTYIRNYTKELLPFTQKWEGFIPYAYYDGDAWVNGKPVKASESKTKKGTLTIGTGITNNSGIGFTFDEKATITEMKNQELLTKIYESKVRSFNKFLDLNRDLILTQEQYNMLLDQFYQGEAPTKKAIQLAKSDWTKFESYLNGLKNLPQKNKEHVVVNIDEIKKEWDALDTLQEKLALTMKWTNIITGGEISSAMQKRSIERSKVFSGDLDIAEQLKTVLVEVAGVDFKNVEGVIEILKQLAPIAQEEGKELELALSKAISTWESKLGVANKELADKALLDQIEEMFSGYELSLELEKLNIPPDLAKQLFNVDSLTLPELKNQVVSMESKFIGTDMEEEYKKFLKKISEMEDKQLKERLQKYTKYLVKGQGERVKIKMEEIRQLQEIEELPFDAAQKELARQGVQEETRQKLDKLEWEEFKDSGIYVQLFEDLEYASTKALKTMRERLMELKTQLSDLDADDLKHLYDQIEKLDEQLSKRNPYKTVLTGVDDYFNAIKESKRLEDELYKSNQVTREMQSQEVDLSERLSKEKAIYEKMSLSGKASKEDLNTQQRKIASLNSQLALLKSQLAAQGKLTKELEQQLDGYKAVRKTFEGSFSDVMGDISEAFNALPGIASDLENVFGTMSAGTKDTIDSIATIGGGLASSIQGFSDGNYIQGVVGLAQAIGGIFAIGDKKKERQIQREIEKVEDLQHAYEKLEKAIDDAYSLNTLQQSGKLAKQNIDAQIRSYRNMIAAEEDKKKTDNDRIKEWKYAIEDLQEQLGELNEQLVSTATGGIMDEVLSAAQEFTDAWLSAFQETGDGLSGLEDNFKETMLEMVKQQASMLITQQYVNKWKSELEKYINPDDLNLTTAEAGKWVDTVTSSLPQLNEALENYFNSMKAAGVDISGEDGGELSGLQRGIQGITEQQADVLAAYWNSCRFFLANIDMTVTNIANQILGGENTPNPMLNELRTQTEMVRAIRDMLSSVIRGSHSLGGQGLKVFIS